MPVETPVDYVCTPSSLLKSAPCVQCLSVKEMLAAIVAIFIISLETTPAQAFKDSACFTCLSDKQMMQGLVTVLGSNILGEGTSESEILAMLACLRCASDKQLKAAALYLLCNGFAIDKSQND